MSSVVTLRPLVVTAALLVAGALACQPAELAAQISSLLPPQRSPVRPPWIVEAARLPRLELWLKAVLNHEPGKDDQSAKLVSSWSAEELRTLWIDLNVLVRLMRNPDLRSFNWSERDQKPAGIRYSTAQLTRLRALACAAAGTLLSASCLAISALHELDADLRELAIRAADARLDDADNFILRRGALLHADVAMLSPYASANPPQSVEAADANAYRITIADGRQTALRYEKTHWDIGRGLLGYVRPANTDRPAPGKDEMVRRWYVATAAWMQDVGDYDTRHLQQARDVFPADPEILFLSGCLHEVYASPPVQAVAKAAVLPSGVTLTFGGEERELRQAETSFRRSLEANPAQPETRLRLGHVLSRLNRQADAARELRKALASTVDDLLVYYGSMFLGAATEALELYDEAKASLERAAALYPSAQSPRLALSELARRRGDRAGALREMQQVFALPVSQVERYDPWWGYDKAQARNAGDLLSALRQPFLEGSGR